MKNEPRIVADTNIVISAVLLPRSIPRKAFDLARIRGRILVSATTIVELEGVLRRPKFDKYIQEADRLEFMAELVRVAELVQVVHTLDVCRDAKDNAILELALSGRATHILTGDADLLVLHPFRNISILTAQQFLSDMTEVSSS